MGQRGNGLGPADGERTVDAGQIGGGQYQVVAFATRRRHHHDDFADTGHLGRHGIHQHRARIGGLAARHVDADPVERRDLLAEQRAVVLDVAPRAAQLVLVIASYPVGGLFQRDARRIGDAPERRFQFGAGQFQRRGGRRGETIEAGGIFDQRGIAAHLDVFDDRGNGGVDRRILRAFKGEQPGQRGVEAGLGGIQNADRHGLTPTLKFVTDRRAGPGGNAQDSATLMPSATSTPPSTRSMPRCRRDITRITAGCWIASTSSGQ